MDCERQVLNSSELLTSKSGGTDLESLRGRLTSATCHLSQHIATQRSACLAQVWVPGEHQDGSVTLHTQGVPFSVSGCADLLALFRCVSCRYKFGTDPSKPVLMGAVGRVFTTGQPEMSHNVQQYDKQQFLRVEEAHRCRVHSALFMPIYTSASRRQPFGVFEVVQADTDVLFPVLLHWLKCCLQEVQLYTVDADQQAMTMGLRTHALGTSHLDSPTLKRFTNGTISVKEESDSQGHNSQGQNSQGQNTEPCLATRTHCSATSLHAQGHRQGNTARSDTGAATKPACRLHEVTADSEEVKQSSSRDTDGGSPQVSSPAPGATLGPCRMSSTQQQQSGELQTGSGGSIAIPASVAVASCPPAQLVAIGRTLQLQTSSAPTDLQTPLFAADKSLAASSASVRTITPATSPFVQQQVQNQLQQQQQQQQQQHQLQFLAKALQLQSQLKAHTQIRPGTPAAGGSAFAGYQPFSPSVGMPHPSTSLLPQNPTQAEDEEEGSPRGDDDMQINNRVAGGAGKRLSVEDLQSQFGFGLREAAHNLRICPTTLKRACRRHGIYRWPRRQSWGGGAGDVGSTESMNLDGDSVSSAGLAAGSDLSSLAAPTPAAGDTGVSGRPSSSKSGPTPGQTLEGFRNLDSSAQLAFLQRLAAAKPETIDNKWLQGNNLNAARKLTAFPRAASSSVHTPAVPVLAAPDRQLGSGVVVSMLANATDPMSHLSGKAVQAGVTHQGFAKPATLLHQPSMPSMARQHSMPVLPCQQPQPGPRLQQQKGFFERQYSAGIVPGLARQSSGALPQGIAQQPNLAMQFPSGLYATALAGANTNLSSSSSSCFTSVFTSQPAAPQHGISHGWQQQQHTMMASHMPSKVTPQLQHQLPTSMVHLEAGSKGHQGQAATLDSMECLQSPMDVGVDSGSGQGSAAMEFDSADHGLGSLDLLVGADLSLDHPDALDFDPADCLF